MIRLRQNRRGIRLPAPAGVLLTAMLLCPSAGHAQSAASMAPADTGLFVQMDDLATWRREWYDHPLIHMIGDELGFNPPAEDERDKRGSLRPLTPNAVNRTSAWVVAMRDLDMSGAELFDTYFGKRVVLIGNKRPGGRLVLLTRVTEKDAKHAAAKLRWQQLSEAGGYRFYASADLQTFVAVGRGWIGLASMADRQYLVDVVSLRAKDKRLAGDKTFQTWMGRLPEGEHAMVGYVRQGASYNALAVDRAGDEVRLHYAGYSPSNALLLAAVGEASDATFGPVPRENVLLATSNQLRLDMETLRGLDPATAAQAGDLVQDLLPNIRPPGVMFIGQLPPGRLVDRKFATPVFGAAVRVGAPEAVDSMNVMAGALVKRINALAVLSGYPQISVSNPSYRGHSFYVADVSNPLVRTTGAEELRDTVRLAYGRIGDWYVFCTHDTFYRQCIAAVEDREQSLDAQLEQAGFTEARRPIARMWVRPQQVALHLRTWLTHWEASGIRDGSSPARTVLDQAGNELADGMDRAREVFAHFENINFELWRGERDEDQTLYGRMVLRRRHVEADRDEPATSSSDIDQ